MNGLKMKLASFVAVFMCCLFFVGCGSHAAAPTGEAQGNWNELRLFYDEPAEKWTEALPVGNGRLGAMVFGTVEDERIQFNEDSLWTGGPRDYTHPGAAEHLPTIRQMLFEGKQREAEKLAMEEFMSDPLRQEKYQPFGDLRLHFEGHAGAQEYRRSLDLDRALASVRYVVDGTTFVREVFSSYPDQAIIVRVRCDKPGGLNFTATMDSPQPESETVAVDDKTLALRGKIDRHEESRIKGVVPEHLRFESRVRVRTDGGTAEVRDDTIHIKGADDATFYLAAATSYVNYRDVSGKPGQRCAEVLRAVARKSYSALLKRHVADYRQLFRRSSLELGDTDAKDLSTDVRIERFADGNDPDLLELYYQFGRFLLIASSRPGSQPANLQGIWNDKMNPPWESKWTVNINTPMNYWPAELCNLSECHEALFHMLDEVAKSGAGTAKVHYDCGGWVLHHNTDLWRGTAPINHSNHGIWVTGGAWLCQHLWERYAFTQDAEFLRERAYPLMKGAAEFFVDFLIEDPDTGWLISTPSNSPEIGGLVAGPTMDHQIIRDLFGNCIEASRILGVDADLRKKLAEMKERIAPNQIGKHGQLQEWLEDKDNPNNHHRHVSHLFGLHPGKEITKRGTPELFEAAKKSLEFRGDGGTGWSMAWKVNFWARFQDGDHAYKMLSSLLTPGRMYPNMFDAHPPFQIDGNFGGIAGIAEMLVQSHTGEIDLLPALPSAWPSGWIEGVRSRGGFELDIAWDGGRLTTVRIESVAGRRCRLRSDATLRVLRRGKEIQVDRPNWDVVEFDTEPGDVYLAFPR